MSRTVKLRWARKLMKAKYFVILTDKESVIALNGVNPDSMTDALALEAQAAAIRDFHDKLGELIKKHDNAISKLHSVSAGKSRKTKTTTNRKVKKIKVKQG